MSTTEKLRQYAAENYGEKVESITNANTVYATKLSGMVKMMEAYYDVYAQNQKEIINLCCSIALENAKGDDDYQKQILRTTKNKLNKLSNMDERFQKFIKLFKTEFTSLFTNGIIEEILLDAFDKFWEEHVLVTKTEIKIKDESN
jgi:hypothetical protein